MHIPSVEHMDEILDYIDEAIAQNKTVYLHCWGGVGRTGTVVGCYLIRHVMANHDNVFEIIQQLKSESSLMHRNSPENDMQRNFVLKWIE